MTQGEMDAVVKEDIVSRMPGVVDPLRADVGRVAVKGKHSFTVIWKDSRLPPTTFWNNSDTKLEEITLHKPDFH